MEYKLHFITKDHNIANNIFPIIAGNGAQMWPMSHVRLYTPTQVIVPHLRNSEIYPRCFTYTWYSLRNKGEHLR